MVETLLSINLFIWWLTKFYLFVLVNFYCEFMLICLIELFFFLKAWSLFLKQIFDYHNVQSITASQAKCNRLPKDVIDYNASLLLINSNFKIHEPALSSFSRNPHSQFFLSTITRSFLIQITSHKVQHSSFFILFHFNWLKFQITLSNGKTIEEAQGFFE